MGEVNNHIKKLTALDTVINVFEQNRASPIDKLELNELSLLGAITAYIEDTRYPSKKIQRKQYRQQEEEKSRKLLGFQKIKAG